MTAAHFGARSAGAVTTAGAPARGGPPAGDASLVGPGLRYGGEEFAVLLTAGADRSTEVAQRLCDVVAGSPVDCAVGPLAVTVSAGTARRQAPTRASVPCSPAPTTPSTAPSRRAATGSSSDSVG